MQLEVLKEESEYNILKKKMDSKYLKLCASSRCFFFIIEYDTDVCNVSNYFEEQAFRSNVIETVIMYIQ
jgi:hypothetical protein